MPKEQQNVGAETGAVDGGVKSRLTKELLGNTPGIARSQAAKAESDTGGAGVRFLIPPEPTERVDFALWFGPLPCFQVGTFRMCL